MRSRGKAGKILASVLLFAVGLYSAPKAAAAFKNVQVGAEAPEFRLKDVSGNEVSLDAFKNDKAVILVFFATWSGRSMDELKDIQKMVPELEPKGLKVIAVNVDHEHMSDEDLKAVRGKAADMKLSFPVVFDSGLDTYRGYGVVAVPSTAILGEGGVIRHAVNGYPSFVLAEMREQVEVLLGLRKAEEAAVAAKADTAYKPNRKALLNYNLGRRLHASGMDDNAERKLATAVAADPGWAAPRILLGDILLAKARKDPGKAAEARKEFEAAVAAEKENVVARTGLARVQWKMGLVAEAEKEVGEALRLGASYPPAMMLKAAILAGKGNVAEAETLIRGALELSPRDPEAHALAGRAYEAAGDLGKAAGMYRKAWLLAGE
ncbi:MAG: redoxin domain-containing protein [Deltaproteobacteria bacterium]|nr:redoxin domain-containing protein [Deltaproteobacteria bacterium]